MLPVPFNADITWCEMANAMYENQGYQTQLMAEHYILGRVDGGGKIVNARYDLKEFFDYDGTDLYHQFTGEFKRVELFPDMRPRFTDTGMIHHKAYVRLEMAADIDDGVKLCIPGQAILLPLAGTNTLFLERR